MRDGFCMKTWMILSALLLLLSIGCVPRIDYGAYDFSTQNVDDFERICKQPFNGEFRQLIATNPADPGGWKDTTFCICSNGGYVTYRQAEKSEMVWRDNCIGTSTTSTFNLIRDDTNSASCLNRDPVAGFESKIASYDNYRLCLEACQNSFQNRCLERFPS